MSILGNIFMDGDWRSMFYKLFYYYYFIPFIAGAQIVKIIKNSFAAKYVTLSHKAFS